MMNKNNLINLVLFQGLWFAAVVGSAHHLGWPAYLLCVGFIVWQLQPSRTQVSDIHLMGIAILMGLILDTTWIQLGLIEYTHTYPTPGIAPAWIIALWAGFALTINHSLSWLKPRIGLAMLFGGFGGPLSYYAGVRFGALEYQQSVVTVSVVLAVAWAASQFIFMRLAGCLGSQNK